MKTAIQMEKSLCSRVLKDFFCCGLRTDLRILEWNGSRELVEREPACLKSDGMLHCPVSSFYSASIQLRTQPNIESQYDTSFWTIQRPEFNVYIIREEMGSDMEWSCRFDTHDFERQCMTVTKTESRGSLLNTPQNAPFMEKGPT